MPVPIAVVGAGTISHQYLENLTNFADLEVVYVADQIPERAAAVAAQYGVLGSGDLAGALASTAHVVVNLTIPAAHRAVTLAALEAGKHVWVEKPLTTSLPDARQVLERARELGLVVAGAPDTFLGAGWQSALRFLGSQQWGAVTSGQAWFATAGPQGWHPDPSFLFDDAARGGPLFDMGPYYFTTLVAALGPVQAVSARGSRAASQRVIGSGPKAGSTFPVTAFSTISVLAEFAGGAHFQLTLSWDSGVRRSFYEAQTPGGTVELPDPNRFDGLTRLHSSATVGAAPLPVQIAGADAATTNSGTAPLSFSFGDDPLELPLAGTTYGRGIGVVDLVQQLAAGAGPRASGELMAHVLEVMEAADLSARTDGQRQQILSAPAQPALVDPSWDPAAATGL